MVPSDPREVLGLSRDFSPRSSSGIDGKKGERERVILVCVVCECKGAPDQPQVWRFARRTQNSAKLIYPGYGSLQGSGGGCQPREEGGWGPWSRRGQA